MVGFSIHAIARPHCQRWVIAALVWGLGAGVVAIPDAAIAGVTGRIQQEVAGRIGSAPAVTKGLSFLQAEGTTALGTRGRAVAIGRVFYDWAADAFDPTTINPRLAPGDAVLERFAGARLKEAYVDLWGDRTDLRVGRQIVRWGVLEGTRITDRVNPLNFREFLFRDVEDRYIPLWMVRLDHYPEWGRIQLVVIPELRFHKPAPEGSEWAEFELPPDLARPRRSVANTEYGFRISRRIGAVAASASYLYTWDDFPAAFRSIFGVGGQLTGAQFDSRYERLHILGTTLSWDLWSSVVSIEAAYDRGKQLATDVDAGIPGGELKRDILRAGVGVDVNLGGVDMSVLYFEERVLHWRPFLPIRPVERAGSLLLRQTWHNNRVEGQLLVLFFATGHQYVARPTLGYRMTDRLKWTLGFDLLGGARSSEPDDVDGARDFRFVSFFRDHDRVTMTVAYRF